MGRSPNRILIPCLQTVLNGHSMPSERGQDRLAAKLPRFRIDPKADPNSNPAAVLPGARITIYELTV